VNLSTTTGGPTSVASASGALPIYNTTDTYGTTKGTGTRTDSNSSSIVLALSMDGTNNGTTFTDESATIKGSGSAKTLTRNGDTKTVTSQSKFYGSSGSFDGTGDYLSHGANTDFAFGTGDLTVELWVYFNSLPGSGVAGLVDTGTSVNANRFSVVVYPNGATYVDSNVNLIVGTAGKITTGKWIHLAVCRSGTNATLYINGVADKTSTVSTDFSNDLLRVGATIDNLYLNGYIQDLRIYKGVAKYTGNFNPPSSTANATIAAGNDSLIDVPTNGSEVDSGLGGQVTGNYCTWNPLSGSLGTRTLSNGNLDTSNSGNGNTYSTFELSSGKWYVEATLAAISGSSGATFIGITASSGNRSGDNAQNLTPNVAYGADGTKIVDAASSSYGASFTANDVIGIAFDIDGGSVTFYKNGSTQGAISKTLSGAGKGTWSLFTVSASGSASNSWSLNAGQRPFAYTAPSGFKALNTANLPAPVVTKPSDVMDVALYTGNGAVRNISGLGFSPDMVWIKSRSASGNHRITDIVRGATKELSPDLTNAEGTDANGVTAFNSDGFSLGISSFQNGSGTTYAAWAWDAGSSTVTNTQGSISSQVRANASAGFSVGTWTGTASAGTIGHGLGVAPEFIIVKNRSVADSWYCYHKSLGNAARIQLNETSAATTGSSQWNSTSPTSTVYSVGSGSWQASGNLIVSYAFAPVVGYSSFGSYTGNGSTDGPFVYTGFRPRWILFKSSSSSASDSDWTLWDSARSPYNAASKYLLPNRSNAEGDVAYVDLLSNGFKMRYYDAGPNNASGGTYIYAAFAESPFAANNRAR
jgi:hypothetical protein